MNIEVGGERAGKVPLEQQYEPASGDCERDQDGNKPACYQAQSQRAPPHPGTSGTK
jgi:hypothetical protein